ncbi:MAG: hypothetical protein ACPGTG_08380, partial [Flavobacteriales bacterium]
MKDRIVFWGTNEQEQDLLVALRLRTKDNRVDLWHFPKSAIDDEFAEKLRNNWEEVDFDNLPEHSYLERDMSEPSLLPDDIKTLQTELVSRAEKEWFVKVLSHKLTQKLKAEIGQLEVQVNGLDKYDPEIWDLAKSFWDKVNQHYQTRDLSKEDTSLLRDQINRCFDRLKKLRKVDNDSFFQEAQENAQSLITKVKEIGEQVTGSKNMNALFQQLKALQQESRDLKMTRKLGRDVKKNFDIVFEALREGRKKSDFHRLSNRIKGLNGAIHRMEKSLGYDQKDLDFNRRRIANSSGKLEAQLREAKIQMIESRVKSKQTKLEDMYSTLAELQLKEQKMTKAIEVAAAKAKAKAEAEVARKAAAKAKAAAKVEAKAKAEAEKAAIAAAEKAKAEAEAAEKAIAEAENESIEVAEKLAVAGVVLSSAATIAEETVADAVEV